MVNVGAADCDSVHTPRTHPTTTAAAISLPHRLAALLSRAERVKLVEHYRAQSAAGARTARTP